MAYTKTQWVNNTTPINDTNLNKIEQGIYDNSLVVDAVTNTLNPTDTETYKTAELTEGQITDVIGVNDILIKGQTSQNGEPTPSSPIDVNVVSGSNVVNIQNKNIAKIEDFKENYTIDGNGLPMSSGSQNRITNTVPINVRAFNNVVVSFKNNTSHTISFIYSLLDAQNNLISRVAGNSSGLSINTSTAEYLYICFYDNVTLQSITEVQVEPNTTATIYEPHQGKELPLDLPVENMLHLPVKSGTSNNVSWSITNNGEIILNGTLTSDRIEVYPLEYKLPNGILTLSKKNSFTIAFKRANGENIFLLSNTSDTKTISNETLVNLVIYAQQGKIFNNEIIKLQLEQSSKANAYAPYGTDPIELCKIGNYQDYFYKSGSKWYLHKEIGKYKFTGDENWTKSGSNNDYYELVSSSISHISNAIGFCNRYKQTTILNGNLNTEVGISIYLSNNLVRIRPQDNLLTNITDFKNDLSNNETILYYPLKEKTDTEITDTTLISQLEAIYNAPLYEQTNITQESNDLPMVLDITACKDNINGIKAFIRK